MTRASAPPISGQITRTYNHLRVAGRLARGLLFLLSMSGLATSAACIIPVPLDREPAPKNDVPQILVSLAQPPFGRISHTPSDLFDLSFTVEDRDLARLENPDTLYARLVRDVSSSDIPVLTYELTNLTPVSDDPERVSGRFGPYLFCAVLSSPVTVLTLVVSDRKFVDQGSGMDPTLSPGGATDSRQWILECQ